MIKLRVKHIFDVLVSFLSSLIFFLEKVPKMKLIPNKNIIRGARTGEIEGGDVVNLSPWTDYDKQMTRTGYDL